MKLQMIAAAAALSFAFAGSAFAEGAVSATLSAPAPKAVKIVAEGAIFDCAGTSCLAAEAPTRANSVLACKAVVKKVGPVASFGAGNKTLSADQLAKCNGVASTQTAAR
jgi:hypothetical protein